MGAQVDACYERASEHQRYLDGILGKKKIRSPVVEIREYVITVPVLSPASQPVSSAWKKSGSRQPRLHFLSPACAQLELSMKHLFQAVNKHFYQISQSVEEK